MRSVYLQKNKDIFKVHALPAEEFAQSIGLPGAPKIKFVKASAAKDAQRAQAKEKSEALNAEVEEDEASGSEEESEIEENVVKQKVGVHYDNDDVFMIRDLMYSVLVCQANVQDRKDVSKKESKHSF